ncbi:hypothetical protein [Streptacidiphilus jiangxiensis]|uniref:Uncharacterized protein n=1 Tax=Streptacidiphilus jiangxiensis TaxID=235985 RepID=A0A1H7YEP3_STRJI|nr:hypothetical protein [Streptacidiphilus jiangxiensis]SEM44344.1 hypothetical protein SAMN05414137_12846 [Streptacidiphilus jiangxiensis]
MPDMTGGAVKLLVAATIAATAAIPATGFSGDPGDLVGGLAKPASWIYSPVPTGDVMISADTLQNGPN